MKIIDKTESGVSGEELGENPYCRECKRQYTEVIQFEVKGCDYDQFNLCRDCLWRATILSAKGLIIPENDFMTVEEFEVSDSPVPESGL